MKESRDLDGETSMSENRKLRHDNVTDKNNSKKKKLELGKDGEVMERKKERSRLRGRREEAGRVCHPQPQAASRSGSSATPPPLAADLRCSVTCPTLQLL